MVVLSVYAHFMPSDNDLAREIMNGFFTPGDSGRNALEMTSARPGRPLWLVNTLPLHFSM